MYTQMLFRIKVGATFKCFKYIFMKSENITLRQSFISTTFEYTLNVQFSQKSLANHPFLQFPFRS